jgi:hypothetical protein
MSNRRKHIPLKTKLAAALCQMLRPNADGRLEPVIDHESSKAMTEDQVLSVFNWDHYPVPKHRDGSDAHWNLTPRPIIEHRRKSATIDTPGAAKDARLSTKQSAFRSRMLAKLGRAEESKQTKAGRPIDGSKSSPWKKKINGTVERR